jgi:hypothetical protein
MTHKDPVKKRAYEKQWRRDKRREEREDRIMMKLDLPSLPGHMANLHRDARGYPVPFFVAWMKDGQICKTGQGEPDFRVIAPGRSPMRIYRAGLCWICGRELRNFGEHVYVIGPMCCVNRVTSEPACHRDCAEYAAMACPFLTRPRQKRDHKDMPENTLRAGIPIDHNPGATCLYETPKCHPFQSGEGWLFRLGEPRRVDWYANGRVATRAEVEASIESSYPILLEMAKSEGAAAVKELVAMRKAAMSLLPAA